MSLECCMANANKYLALAKRFKTQNNVLKCVQALGEYKYWIRLAKTQVRYCHSPVNEEYGRRGKKNRIKGH